MSISRPGKEMHIYDYLRILYKWRKIAAICFIVIVGIVTIASLIMTPVYKATARIMISREMPKALDMRQLIPIDATGTEFYQTQYKILQSRALVMKVIQALNLDKNKVFSPSQPKVQNALEKNKYETRLVKRFLGSYTIEPIRNSRLVDVSFLSRDAVLATDVANTIAKAYIIYNIEQKTSTSSEAKDFLTKQIEEHRKKLEESEQALQSYKEKYGIVQLTTAPGQKESENIAMQRLAGLTQNLVQAQSGRIEAEGRYNEVQNLIKKGVPYESIPPIANSPLIQTLRSNEAKLTTQLSELSQKYGEKHPRMVQLRQEINATRQKIRLEAQSVVNAIRNEYSIAQAKEAHARSAVEGQKTETQKLSEHSIQYGVLLREVEKNRELYENLLKKLKETTVEQEFGATNIKIIDLAAIPTSPAKPKRIQNILLSIIVGLFLGVGVAFFMEYLDNTVKTPEDIKEYFDAPSLAIVPVLDFKAEVGELAPNPQLIVHHKPKSTVAETFRSIRTAILFSFPENPPKTILVTSFVPQEGKSFVAANTAMIMAYAGDRVLLIDCDLRRPSVHKAFGIENEKGITNMIVAGDMVVRPHVIHENLSVITSGPIPPNPSELLGSRKMLDLMEAFKERYDKIVIDTPPISSVTDALVVSKLMDCAVIHVVHGGSTTKEMLRQAREMLDGVNARVLGAVLNNSQIIKGGYYYSHYYHYYRYYNDYYGDDDKSKKTETPKTFWGRAKTIVKKELGGSRKEA